MSNYHGSKELAINLISHYLIDIMHKTRKPSHLEKLQITQNINTLMFQFIFIFPDLILIKKIIVSSTYVSKTSTWGLGWGTGTWVKMHRFNPFSRNVNTLKFNFFPTQSGIYKSDNSKGILNLKSLKIDKHMKDIKNI